MIDSADLKRLQWALLLLFVLAVTGAGAVVGTQMLLKDAENKNRELIASRLDVKARLNRARDEEQELRDKIARYQQLGAQGYIGEELRLDWIEAIARIKKARRIYQLEYEFAPQRPADAGILPGGSSGGGFDFMSSQMRLQMQLLHEDDLFNVISDLRKEVRAIIQVHQCGIQRLAPDGSQRASSAQLKAECTLEWITLKEKK